MTALITTALGVLAIILQAVVKYRESQCKKEADRNEEIQKGRTAIAAGNVAAVGERIDSVPQAAPGHTAKLGTDEDTARRLAEITGGEGLAPVGRGDGEAAGGRRIVPAEVTVE